MESSVDHGSLNFAALLVDGDRILPALLEDIRAARSSVHVSMFLWFRDPIGEEVADAIIERARAGVTARVLINVSKTGMGDPFSTGEKEMMEHDPSMDHSPLDIEPMCERMRAAGVEVVDTNIDYDRVIEGLSPRLVSIAAQIRSTIAIDDLHVDHRKIVVIDGRVGYTGGANVGAQYLYHVPFDPSMESRAEGEERRRAGLSEPWWKWHDSLTRFEGPIVGELERAFHDRFVLDGGREYSLPAPLHGPLSHLADVSFPIASAQVFMNEPNDRPNEVRELYVRLIREARRSIFIENPYLYHPAIVDALCETKEARPELDVVLVLPGKEWNDNAFAQDAQQHHYARYVELGVKVFEYQRHFNHFKIAVFDERFSIHGSTNGNFRSLEDDKDFELVVLVDDEPFARDILIRVRDVDVANSIEITREALHGSITSFRIRHRDPRTLLLLSRRQL